ncbi:MAG: hypothetical protein CSA68_12490 [Rhodobacterales bacterium]|nr:MAG: hypothetical protein CSA68_12490 [Rhodobacterales bacterium]
MNKAITDGLVFTPPQFANGLDVWSSQDGTAGADTYENATNAALVAADQDFGGCLELLKTSATQKLRYMGQTPILPGCYLRITARVKAVSGNLATVRIAGWAGDGSDNHVSGLVEAGPEATMTSYGDVVTVSAIVGTGARSGVDMVWGSQPVYGHFGLDLTGPTGGVVRIDDIEIEDVTSAFLRDMMDWVDVKDFGAVGDGVTDDQPAFEAADAAANGRRVLVSAGTYHLGDHMTFENPARFEGTVTMPADKRLVLLKNFDLPSYINAFGNEKLALEKALQALLNFSDHESLDMCGRRVELDGPIDVHGVVGNKNAFAVRRVLRNGQLNAVASNGWDTEVVTSNGTYSTSAPNTLTNVANVANIPIGSLVTGNGVGREVYVRSKNIGANTVTLSLPLHDAVGTQNYTFTRFKYILDFSGFNALSRFQLDNVELFCNGIASGVMLAPGGMLPKFRDCAFIKPKDRGITSIGAGCQGLQLDRCQFASNEQAMRAQDRTTIALNVNKNDPKLRDNQVHRFAHFAILAGRGNVIEGNHWYQGDEESNALRTAGIVFTGVNVRSIVNGNYIDNSFVEMSNEHEPEPDNVDGFTFGGLNIVGNTFVSINVAPWFKWIVITPYGSGHSLQGFHVIGNTIRALNGQVDRIEGVDTSHATLDFGAMRNVSFEGNTFNNINDWTISPVTLEHNQASDNNIWTVDFAPYLPFGGWARKVTAVVADGLIRDGNNSRVTAMPYTVKEVGPNHDQIRLNWPTACRGKVQVTARVDQPT